MNNSVLLAKRRSIACVLVLLQLQLLFFENGLGEVNVLPEFTEPIKNMTTSSGSNVELSCYVKHLGSYRIMWLKREGEKETFVAINLLKITRNPRVTISLLQVQDDITQSNVYIHNTETDDTGVYECAVNTNPMISQTGTLEVTGSTMVESTATVMTPEEVPPLVHHYHKHSVLETQSDKSILNDTNSDNNATYSSEEDLDKSGMSSIGANSNNSKIVCADVKDMWYEATDSLKEIIKNVLNSLVNFTCSFITPNN